MKLEGKKILITGGAGFIGSNLCEYFLPSNQVRCLDNFLTGSHDNLNEFSSHPNFELVEGDIRSYETCREACDGVDLVTHQAALGSVPRSVKDPRTTHAVNADGFLNVLEAARDAGVSRVVYASSSSVYGDHPGMPKIETALGEPLSPYAITKRMNELYALNFATLYNMDCIGLRYFNVFGRRQSPEGAYAAVIPRFIKSLLGGERPKIFGDGSQSRDFTYIDNVLQINEQALSCPRPTLLPLFNVACGESMTVEELALALRDLLAERDPKIKDLTPEMVEPRAGDIKHSLASINAAQNALGYQPTHDAMAGLKESIDWYWKALR